MFDDLNECMYFHLIYIERTTEVEVSVFDLSCMYNKSKEQTELDIH